MHTPLLQQSTLLLFVGLLVGCQPNNPPIAVPAPTGTIGVQQLVEGERVTIVVSRYFEDQDADPLSYTATSANSDVATTIVADSSVIIVAHAEGNATIIVTASDPDGLTAEKGISVSVKAANRAPEQVGTIGVKGMREGETVEIDLSGHFRDPERQAMTYLGSTSDTSVARSTVSGSTVEIVGTGVGRATITVTARDPEGLTATQRIRVDVEAANQAPETIGAIGAQRVREGEAIQMNVSRYFRDPEGRSLIFLGVTSDPSVARGTVSGSMLTIAGVGPGTATIAVTARDPEGLAAMQQIDLEVERMTVDIELCRIIRDPNAVYAQPGLIGCAMTIAYREYMAASPGDRNATKITDFTTNDGQIGGAVISNDDQLYYWIVEDRIDARVNLWKTPTNGGGRTRVTNVGGLNIDPTMAPGTTRLVFASDRNGRPSSLWFIHTDRGIGTTVATQSDDRDYAPSLSADGSWVAFERWPPGAVRPQIWKLNFENRNQTQLLDGHRPRVSPDGSRILFSRPNGETGRFQIWVMGADGAGEQLLSPGLADHDEIHPSWSPDGSAIVFVSNEGLDPFGRRNYDIWSMSLAQGNADRTQLTEDGSHDDEPIWHTDGRIYFRSNRGGGWNIWYLSVGGANTEPEPIGIEVGISASAGSAPTLVGTVPPQELPEGGTVAIDMSQYFADPEGDSLSYQAATSDSAVATPFVRGHTVIVYAEAEGTVTVTVTARDPDGLTATQEIRVSVSSWMPTGRSQLLLRSAPDLLAIAKARLQTPEPDPPAPPRTLPTPR